ncbi:hypothetical protein O181_053990 [Austropuccinia psidii MF-1]|uniref:Uncharacterized protein n=1 Tax=Austropuccinia psidii MF-1 TaxID=1389203 RepID=A0A9Q3E1K7_9BASI|nr:hypothetical protein [Austropuccinia psidii MF-1]
MFDPKWPKPTLGPKLTKNHKLAINQSMASGNHQRPPDQLQAGIPLQFRGRLPFLPCTPYSNYAPFLLRNPMVTLSGPNYVIPNEVSKPSPSLKEEFSAIKSGSSLSAIKRPFDNPNHLALQGLGFQFSPGLF